MTDASIDMGAAFEAGIKANFPNAEITIDKFHVISSPTRRSTKCGARRRGTTSRSRAGAPLSA